MDDGRMYGNIVNDTFEAQAYLPLELRPVRSAPHLSYEDTLWDEVGRVLERSEE